MSGAGIDPLGSDSARQQNLGAGILPYGGVSATKKPPYLVPEQEDVFRGSVSQLGPATQLLNKYGRALGGDQVPMAKVVKFSGATAD